MGETTPPPSVQQTAVPGAKAGKSDKSDKSDNENGMTGWPKAAPAAKTMLSELDRKVLGGYQLAQKLGQGGMGAVYLAKQLSLDRNVAVKVLHPRWATDPQFVARFTREAFAAAQLVHHNVVQIHDIGAQERTHYYSMEFVEGQNLADVLKRDGKLEAEVAVTMTLQAARGLKFAHDRGMIHRDVKPENLMLNAEGIVKVADLGLVKTGQAQEAFAGSRSAEEAQSMHQTSVKVAMGTPLYMPPEQAKDAAKVDARADIYSLGCTLYALLVGNPPFAGRTAAELARKHLVEQPVPPHQRNKRVPEDLSKIVLKMMAKKPEDRYANMGEVIAALEDYLGVRSSGPVSAQEEHIAGLEDCVRSFNEAPLARIRPNLIAVFVGLCALMTAYWIWFGSWQLAGSFVGAAALTGVAYFIISGAMERRPMFGKLRHLAFSASWREWLNAAVGIALVVTLLALLHWLVIWIWVLMIAVLLAAAFYVVVDRQLARQRQGPLNRTHALLKKLRQRGMDENALRHFVCKYAGRQWEEYYESLFGYDAKLEARLRWGLSERGQPRPRYRGWRDPVIRWVDARDEGRREEQAQRHLQMVEAKSLQAQGMDEMAARLKAKRRAEAMVAHAAEFRATASGTTTMEVDAPSQPAGETLNFEQLFNSTGEPSAPPRKHQWYLSRRYGGPLYMLFRRQTRFICAVLLLVPFFMWRVQNPNLTRDITDVATAERKTPESLVGDVRGKIVDVSRAASTAQKEDKKLEIPGLPDEAEIVLGSWNAGVAGLILLASALFYGRLLAMLVYLGAAIALGGYRLMPDAAAEASYAHLRNPQIASMLIGLAIAGVAVFFFREVE